MSDPIVDALNKFPIYHFKDRNPDRPVGPQPSLIQPAVGVVLMSIAAVICPIAAIATSNHSAAPSTQATVTKYAIAVLFIVLNAMAVWTAMDRYREVMPKPGITKVLVITSNPAADVLRFGTSASASIAGFIAMILGAPTAIAVGMWCAATGLAFWKVRRAV